MTGLPRYRPYLGAAAGYEIGLRPLDMRDWLHVGPDHGTFMAAKRARLAGCPPLYYRTLDGSRAAQAELLRMVAANLREFHGEDFAGDGDVLVDRRDGSRHDLAEDGRDPLAILGGLAEEDFVLFDPEAGPALMIAASNAYTSSGRIVSCVGHGMHFAHEQVPGLNEALAARIDRVIAHVQAEKPVVRFNWFVTPIGTRLYPQESEMVHEATGQALARRLADDPDQAGALLWLRVEQQSFVRLPETRALAFGIHTYSDPLSSIEGDRDSLAALHRLLGSYSDERLAYGGMLVTRAAILRWIEARL